MFLLNFLFCFLIFLNKEIYSLKVPDNCWRAAVYEHVKIHQPDDSAGQNIDHNLDIYEQVVSEAKLHNPKIIVFPESGLSELQYDKKSMLANGSAAIVPNLKTNPCSYYRLYLKGRNETKQLDKDVAANIASVGKLSCLAFDYQIYLAANVYELNETDNGDYHLYNTNLVFNDKGILIQKYRKFNLYNEPSIDKPEKPDISTFTIKGVGKFGLATSTDILFQHPIKDLVEEQKIDHLIYSAHWVDRLVSFSAASLHSAASFKYGVNVLSANMRDLKNSIFGSSITNPKAGIKVQTYFDKNSKSLLIADLPVAGHDDVYNQCKYSNKIAIDEKIYKNFSSILKENESSFYYRLNWTPPNPFTMKNIGNKQEGKIKNFCHEDVCCNLEYRIKDSSYEDYDKNDYDYYLSVANEIHDTQDPTLSHHVEGCTLFALNKKDQKYTLATFTRFDKLILNAKFSTNETAFPNVMSSYHLSTDKSQWSFKQNGLRAEISVGELRFRAITYVTLLARNYAKDLE